MDILEILKQRRTIRFYKQIDVPKKDLRDMIDAARHASCACNFQTLRYMVVTSQELTEKVFANTAWAGLVKPHRTPVWGVNAARAFIAVYVPEAAKSINHADAGAAICSMQAVAASRGLGCCWLGAINRDNIKAILDMPESSDLLYLLAVGYPAETPVAEDIDDASKVAYYLDGNNTIHVPKLTVDAITLWK